MKKIAILILIYSNTTVLAQTSFNGEKIINQTECNGAFFVTSADIDGDGDMDILTTSLDDNKIGWYENIDGNGAFNSQEIITTEALSPHDLAVADIDGDGDLDVISASFDDHKIAWYENTNGYGIFDPQQIISGNAINATAVFAADIDGDGDMDVLSASQGDNKIAWYENTDGHGTFSAPRIISNSVNEAISVIACDVDGDGDMDVIATSQRDRQIILFKNTNGQGIFNNPVIIAYTTDGNIRIHANDIDGDGDIDLLSAYNNQIVWLQNDGSGTFNLPQTISAGVFNVQAVYTADIDNDGDTDVVSASYDDNKIAWYENTNGNGVFGTQQVITSHADGAISVFATDLDSDGDIDVVSASNNDDTIAWYQNLNGQGDFSVPNNINSTNEGAKCVYGADIDGDGDIDVLSASNFDNKITWHENINGDGDFGRQQIISTDARGANAVYAADIDGDGDLDALSASIFDSKIAWYENTDGNGNFGSQQIISNSYHNASYIHAADIDNDGDMDILCGSDTKISWFENTNGSGTFGNEQVIATNLHFVSCIQTADIDGDGDLDALLSSDDKIVWYDNIDGNGSFSTEHIIKNNISLGSTVHAADFDNDGDMDVLWASKYDQNVSWIENTNGQGTFANEHFITNSFAGPHSVFVADYDADGDMDIVLGASFNITSFTNIDGQGNFIIQEAMMNRLSEYFVSASDVDGDGDIDIFTAYNDTIAWLKNLGVSEAITQNTLKDFNIYPVPAQSLLHISCTTKIVKIEIINLLGKTILTNTNKSSIDTSLLTKGIYLIKITDVNGNFGLKKFIKL